MLREKTHKRFLLAVVLMTVFFLIALFFRVVPPFKQVLVGDWVKFTGADAYYYMRLVDSLVSNFPHFNTFDPYLIYPGGTPLNALQFFPLMISTVSWLIGLGHPSAHLVDVIGAYFPAILGALTVIPVFFLGSVLFNRTVGLLAAAALAIIPGEFLGRSILGFTISIPPRLS